MRIKINFSGTSEKVPFNNQSYVISFLHNCLGRNNKFHDTHSNYSLSTIQGGKKIKGENFLDMSKGCYIVVSSLDMSFMNSLIKTLIKETGKIELCYGMKYQTMDIMMDTFKDGWNHVGFLSPFHLKTSKDKKTTQHTLNDDDFESVLQNQIVNKLSKIRPDLNLKNFKVNVRKSDKNKVRAIDIKQPVNGKRIFNIANQCNLEIFAKKEVMDVLYDIGIGSSTGIGFGSIFNIENHMSYKVK